MELNTILDWIGEKVSFLSTLALEKLSELINQEPAEFMGKLITLIILAGAIYLGSKITQKVAKLIVIFLLIVLGVSIIYSMFV